MSMAASAPVSAPSGPSLTKRCNRRSCGPSDDRHRAALEMRDDFSERQLGDKAQIAGAWGRLVGDQPRDVVGGMQVDLLLAEAQRGAPLTEGDDLHPEHPCIKGAGALDI